MSNARFIIAGNFKGDYSEVEAMFEQRLDLGQGSGRIELPIEATKGIDGPLVLRKPSVPNVYLYVDLYIDRELTIKEKIAMQIISTMLTETMYSRIFGTAREKGWVYGMGSGASYAKNLSSWWLGAQVSKTNSQPLIRLIRDELVRIHDGIIDDTDFESARKHLLGKTMRSGQTASGLVGRYGHYYVDDSVENLNTLPSITKQITKKQCIELFGEIIDSNSWGLGVLGSISLVPARKLHSYINEVFEKAS